MKLLIGGDFYIDDSFAGNNLLNKSIESTFNSADFSIINLEAPLTKNISSNAVYKTGPNIRCSPEIIIPYLRRLNVDLVTLANNHIMDYGAEGLFDTINILKNSEIEYLGAGRNLSEAVKPYILEKAGMKIAILNFTENEWSIAGDDYPGASPVDCINNIRQITKEKSENDYVIVIIHGGNEHFQYPSPRLVNQYHYYVECGADMIIGHHPHCVGGYEIFKGKYIFYSLGNFLFAKRSKLEHWFSGILLSITITKTNINCDIIPVDLDKNDYTLNLSEATKRHSLLINIEAINSVINDPNKLKKKWDEYVNSIGDYYIMSMSPLGRIKSNIIKTVIFRSNLYRFFFNKRNYREILNRVRCEAHRDVLLDILEKKVASE